MNAPRSAAHRPTRADTVAKFQPARGRAAHEIAVAGATLVADPAGAVYWPDERLLAVADLHLEKGSAFAARGVLLPPYDTTATLARLAKLIEHYSPALVVASGDSFHDGGGPARMPEVSRASLAVLQRGRDWLWLAGNHDPDPPQRVGGRVAAELAIGSLHSATNRRRTALTERLPAICIQARGSRSAVAAWRGAASPPTPSGW